MTHEELFDRIAGLLRPLGCSADDGEDFREPPLEVLRYEIRAVRMHWLPVLGRGLSVVAIVRQPVDLSSSVLDCRRLLDRLSRAVHARYPPWPTGGPGLVIGLTAIILTPEPITPTGEAILGDVLPIDRRSRVILLGMVRINLGQEAMEIALGPEMRDVFPEPLVITDGLSLVLGRFVPPLDLE